MRRRTSISLFSDSSSPIEIMLHFFPASTRKNQASGVRSGLPCFYTVLVACVITSGLSYADRVTLDDG
ncbi:MAG: hypothetical protein MUQ67_09880, partial [Pirellulales bacterium]|nr:hypothetical protein [Pirellulales bacterium]